MPCPGEPDCRRLAYLIEEEEDIGLHLVKMSGDAVENQIIGFGWPYYFSWSRDGQSILWHIGGAYQDNPQARIARYDLGRGEVQTLSERPGAFLAPAWSPIENTWLGATASNR